MKDYRSGFEIREKRNGNVGSGWINKKEPFSRVCLLRKLDGWKETLSVTTVLHGAEPPMVVRKTIQDEDGLDR